MQKKIVVTIGREYGSGGRAVGKKLADRLGIAFYNREIIELAARQTGMSEQTFEKIDETAASSLLYSIATGSYLFGNFMPPHLEVPLNDQLFIVQADIIKKIAARESCVIVGRCADYILKDRNDVINVFIHAPNEIRKKRTIEEYGANPNKIDSFLHKMDKKRSTYYNYYTEHRWGFSANYDLCLDSGTLGVDGCVNMIEAFINEVQGNKEKIASGS